MARRQLNKQILALDRQLLLQQYQLRRNTRQRLERLHRVSVAGLLATGLIAGLLVGILVATKGSSIHAIYIGGMRLLWLSDWLVPASAAAPMESPQ